MIANPRIEKNVRHKARVRDARALLVERGTPPVAPDFSDCTDADEVAWVKLGGRAADFRALQSDDEPESIAAFASLSASLGAKPAPTAEVSLSARDAISPENAAMLRRLGLPIDFASVSNSDELAAVVAARKK